VQVIVDSREYRSDVVRYIKEAGCQTIQRQLDVGDYIAGRFIIERKSANDFLSSIVDGRLFDQITRLKASGLKPLIIVEGDLWEAVEYRGVHPNAVLGAQISALRMGLSIIYTPSPERTGHAICIAARQSEREGGIRIPHVKGRSLREQQLALLTALPGVGVKTAEALLKKYGTPLNALNNYYNWPLSEKALAKIRRILGERYEEGGGGLTQYL
jgi:DNA excision repair protein ERCC-4